MKLRLLRGALLLSIAVVLPVASFQDSPYQKSTSEEEAKLPNGKSQRDEILKYEHELNIKDAAHLAELAEGLKTDLEKGDRFVLSMETLKKTDEIEKLVKKIRSRLRN